MALSKINDSNRSFKDNRDMPWRVAPRLKEVVKSKGTSTKKKPKHGK